MDVANAVCTVSYTMLQLMVTILCAVDFEAAGGSVMFLFVQLFGLSAHGHSSIVKCRNTQKSAHPPLLADL